MENNTKKLCEISGNILFCKKEDKFSQSIRSTKFIIKKETDKTISLVDSNSRIRKVDLNKVFNNDKLLTDILNRVSLFVICYQEDEDYFIEKMKESLIDKLEANMMEVRLRLNASENISEPKIKKVDY